MKMLHHSTNTGRFLRKFAFSLSFIFLIGVLTPHLAGAQTVRVLYFSGAVSVKGDRLKLGQQLQKGDAVQIGNGGSLQLSVDGKVVRYSKAGTIKVADAIKSAGSGENSVVANSARTLAGASGAGRSSRTSLAGASRADDRTKQTGYFDSVQSDAVNTGSMRINSEISSATGIQNPMELISKAGDYFKGETIVILQPRSTAVSQGDIRFRWMQTPGIGTYQVSITDYVGKEVYSAETADTSISWNGAGLIPGAIYYWTVRDAANPKNAYRAQFSQIDNAENSRVTTGVNAIRNELGADNPALPIMLGTFYSENGLYGEAAEMYTTGALTTPEHAGTYWEMACDEYMYNMYIPVEEGYRICGGE